jgi:hypothetical protein
MADILADALQRLPLDHRPHVVEHQTTNRGRHCGSSGWPASTMPISPPMLVPTQSRVLIGALLLQLRQQGQHVAA